MSWHNEARVPKVWSLCLSLSLSLSASLSFGLYLLPVFFSFFSELIVVTGRRESPNRAFLKRFLKGLLESIIPGPYLTYTTRQHWHLSLPSCFTRTSNTTCHHFLSFSRTFSLSFLFCFSSPLLTLFYLATSHVLKAVLPFLTSLTLIPAFTPLCLSLWCFNLYLLLTSSFLF